MAELRKIEDFHYDVPIMDEPVMAPQHTEKTKIQGDVLPLPPLSPKKRLRNISVLEKLIGSILILSIVGIAIVTIQVRTSIVQTTNEITDAQATIKEKEETALKLEQEKNELSKADRIKQVAQKQGLSDNDSNLRKVK